MAFILKYAVTYVFVSVVQSGEKRMLLDSNNNDYLFNSLHRLDSLVTLLNKSVAEITLENQQQKQDLMTQKQELQNQQTLIHHLETSLKNVNNNGATYVRWGRKQCRANVELVYSGYAGGGYYDQSGSGSNYVCLPPDPEFSRSSGEDWARMYGAEFDNNFFASNSDNQDVPCAVCRAPDTTTTIMIPARLNCYNGWQREYYGYLTSSHFTKAGRNYECMDMYPEFITGGGSAHNGALFYEVLAKCGSLQCPPYRNNYPLTCVVCSK